MREDLTKGIACDGQFSAPCQIYFHFQFTRQNPLQTPNFFFFFFFGQIKWIKSFKLNKLYLR